MHDPTIYKSIAQVRKELMALIKSRENAPVTEPRLTLHNDWKHMDNDQASNTILKLED